MDRFGVLLAFAVEFFRNAVQQEKFFFGEVFGVNLLTGYTILRQVAARHSAFLPASLKWSYEIPPIQ